MLLHVPRTYRIAYKKEQIRRPSREFLYNVLRKGYNLCQSRNLVLAK